MDANHIRQAVATFAPERLECYDAIISEPYWNGPYLTTAPGPWPNDIRMQVLLHLWKHFDPNRPN